MVPDRPLSYGVLGNALRALQVFYSMTEEGSLDLDRLDLDRADPLVARVEQFVRAYRKVHGRPVR